MKYKDNPEKFEEVKNNLLGNIIKVIRRVNKNEMFDRLEFISRLVFPKPDPKEEIDRMKKEVESKSSEEKVEGKEELPEKLPSVEEI